MKKILFPLIAVVGIVIALFVSTQKEIGQDVVPLAENETKTIEDVCKDQEHTFTCLEAHYDTIVASGGVSDAFSDLIARYKRSEATVREECHQLAHVIGRAAAKKFDTVAEAFAAGNHFCWSGYFHGVMEGTLGAVDQEELELAILTLCENIEGKEAYSFDYYNCVHGLGHGLMFITNNELFESLDLCNTLGARWESESCYGGVFMENVIADGKNHTTNYLKDDDVLYPCNAVEEQYKGQCYLMHTSYMLEKNGFDFASIFDVCASVEEQHVDTCYQSLGRDASGNSISSVEKTRTTCLLGADFRQQSNCIIGAVKDFISYHHSDTQAKQLCESLDGELKATCNTLVPEFYRSFN